MIHGDVLPYDQMNCIGINTSICVIDGWSIMRLWVIFLHSNFWKMDLISKWYVYLVQLVFENDDWLMNSSM